MTELVQLDRRISDFREKNARILVASVEGLDLVGKTQAQFPNLIAVSDEGLNLSRAAGLIHPGAAPDGSDADAPTTILVDRQGVVRWLYRSPSVIERLSPDALLRAIDARMAPSGED